MFCPIFDSNDETWMEPFELRDNESKSLLIDEDIDDKSDSTPSSREEEFENKWENVSLFKESFKSLDLLRSMLCWLFWLDDDVWGLISARCVFDLFAHDSVLSFLSF